MYTRILPDFAAVLQDETTKERISLRSRLSPLTSRFTVFFLPNDEQFHRRHQKRQRILQVIDCRHYVVVNL
jgi:hypothetical protein